ncbi:hypothetical protein [Streptomyces echinatus]|uniref:hypothetical protein n=1 Tax=Streptomyces echinatus TaxID=67293 RepID=UPI003812756D
MWSSVAASRLRFRQPLTGRGFHRLLVLGLQVSGQRLVGLAGDEYDVRWRRWREAS